MDTTTVKRKIANCISASKRSLNPSFQSYWKDTANKLGLLSAWDFFYFKYIKTFLLIVNYYKY